MYGKDNHITCIGTIYFTIDNSTSFSNCQINISLYCYVPMNIINNDKISLCK